MVHAGIASAERRQGAGMRVLGVTTCCWLAFAAWAQPIKLPDFREPPPSIGRLSPGEVCNECGRIISVREIQTERPVVVPSVLQGTGPGSSASSTSDRNLVGVVISLPLGEQSGGRSYVGGVGTPEMQERFRDSTYEVSVQLNDGKLRVVHRPDGSNFRVGDRVRLSGVNQIELIAN